LTKGIGEQVSETVVSYCSNPCPRGWVYTPAFADLRSIEPERCDLDSCNWFQPYDIPEPSFISQSFTEWHHGLCPTLGSHVPGALGWSDL